MLFTLFRKEHNETAGHDKIMLERKLGATLLLKCDENTQNVDRKHCYQLPILSLSLWI